LWLHFPTLTKYHLAAEASRNDHRYVFAAEVPDERRIRGQSSRPLVISRTACRGTPGENEELPHGYSIRFVGLQSRGGVSLAAALLTLTPGLDTALVLRTAAVEGGRRAMQAGSGIVVGVLAWGVIAAFGLGAVLAVSRTAYAVLQMAGAAYLLWLGLNLLWAARYDRPALPQEAGRDSPPGGGRRWFLRGLLTNLLNPKVGVFYVSLLPQFIPADVPVVGFSVLLAGIHAAMASTRRWDWPGSPHWCWRPVRSRAGCASPW